MVKEKNREEVTFEVILAENFPKLSRHEMIDFGSSENT